MPKFPKNSKRSNSSDWETEPMRAAAAARTGRPPAREPICCRFVHAPAQIKRGGSVYKVLVDAFQDDFKVLDLLGRSDGGKPSPRAVSPHFFPPTTPKKVQD